MFSLLTGKAVTPEAMRELIEKADWTEAGGGLEPAAGAGEAGGFGAVLCA